MLGRDHEAGAARQSRKHHRCLCQHVFQAARLGRHARLNRRPFGGSEFPDLQQAIHEQTQAPLGWHPAGAGVRRIEQTQRFEVRHYVANGGRRERVRQALRKGSRAHRLSRGEVGVHEMAKDLARAFAKLAGEKPRVCAVNHGGAHFELHIGKSVPRRWTSNRDGALQRPSREG